MVRHAAPAAPDLIAALKDESAEVRSQAALAIYFSWTNWSIPPHDLNLPAALRPRLRDADPRVRIVAAGLLVDLGVATALEVLPALSEGVLHPDDQFAESIAAGSLGQLGPEAAPMIPALRAALFDRQPPNAGALDVLAKIGEPGVAVLAEALTHPQASVREWAAFYLGEMGQVAVAAVPALRVAQSDKAERVRRAAATGLQRIAGT
jgi:HEAT repeat protein